MRRYIFYFLSCAMLTGLATADLALADDAPEKLGPEKYFNQICVDCHKVKEKPIDETRLSRKEWADALDKMLDLEKLDPVPSKLFMADMLEWLVQHRSPITGDTASVPPSVVPDENKH